MRTMTMLLSFLLLIGCLPWQSPSGATTVETLHIKQSLPQQIDTDTLPLNKFPLSVEATITHPAIILGKKGFSPAELVIQAGDSVTWQNNDPKHKIVTIIFQKDGTRSFITSSQIPPDGSWENVFTESGDFTYWTVAYGTKGKLRVK